MNTASWLEGIRAAEHWRTLIGSRGPRLATGVLAIALAAQAALIVTGLAGGGLQPAAGLRAPGPVHAQGLDVAAIVESHLFGRSPMAAGALGAQAPRTQLPLVLTGVIAERNPHAGMAILGPSAGADRVYAIGDSIPGGARLAAVLPREVLLERDGRLESLALPQQEFTAAPAAAALPAPSLVSPPAFVQHMRELITRRPGLVADLLRPEPVFSGGRQLGYRVYPGNDPQAFGELGLKPGDLVTAINGTPLDDPAQDQQILSTLGSSSQASLTILRNGHQRQLTLDLAQVEQTARQLTATPGPATPAPRPRAFWPSQGSHRPP